eukprot:bmy_05816T0
MTNLSIIDEFVLLGLSSDPDIQTMLFVLFLGIDLLTLIGNLMMILVIRADSHLHTPMYFFLGHLSFLDICYSLVTVPKMLHNFLSQKKTISVWGGITQSFFFMISGVTESCLLSAMAYDRYAAMCHPLLYTVVMNRPLCTAMVGTAWPRRSLLHLLLPSDRGALVLWDGSIQLQEPGGEGSSAEDAEAAKCVSGPRHRGRKQLHCPVGRKLISDIKLQNFEWKKSSVINDRHVHTCVFFTPQQALSHLFQSNLSNASRTPREAAWPGRKMVSQGEGGGEPPRSARILAPGPAASRGGGRRDAGPGRLGALEPQPVPRPGPHPPRRRRGRRAPEAGGDFLCPPRPRPPGRRLRLSLAPRPPAPRKRGRRGGAGGAREGGTGPQAKTTRVSGAGRRESRLEGGTPGFPGR